jgi:hypothetical protein
VSRDGLFALEESSSQQVYATAAGSLISMETISLTDEQEERARDIYHRLHDGEVTHPTDIVEWREPTKSIDYQTKEDTLPRYEEFIDPADIKGTTGSTGRLEKGRLSTALVRLIQGEFEVKNIYPPVLQKLGDGYYVTTDGHHRCIAAKAVGLDEFYVEYEEVPDRLLVDSESA